VDIACWAAITLSGLYYFALLPFRASLVGTHPIASVLLNGSTEAIVSAAAFAKVGHGSIVVVLLASIPGLMKFAIIYWWAGRLWGERVIQLFSGRGKRSQKFVARVNRSGRWLTWPAVVLSPFLPIPNALVYAAAGWTGMSWVTFLVLDAIGTLAWAGMLAGLGWALGHHAVSVAQEISKYGLWFSIAIVVLVVVSQMRGARASSFGARAE
jgi:membrane-associated protein